MNIMCSTRSASRRSAPARRSAAAGPSRRRRDTKQGATVAVNAGAFHDGTPCWTFVTASLAAKQHPELVLSLAIRKSEVAERYPAAAVELLGELAAPRCVPARLRAGRGVEQRSDAPPCDVGGGELIEAGREWRKHPGWAKPDPQPAATARRPGAVTSPRRVRRGLSAAEGPARAARPE
jgi:hypothetical protein